MRRSGKRALLVATLLGAVLALPVSVWADTATSQQYTVTANILPARYIVVNQRGQIRQIISNTVQPVPPTVWLNSLQGQPLPISPELQQIYSESVKHAHNLVGYIPIYKPPAKPKPLQFSLADLTTGSLLPFKL